MSSIPETFLKSYRPETFDGRYRDTRAEDWLIRFERYCNAARIPETGQDRILCAGLLLTDSASRCRITHFDDKDAVRFFRGGLKPEIRQLVDNHPEIADDDINGLIALAERLDKMNKHNRQFTRTFRPPQAPRVQETFPQPMELDAIHAHPNTQSKFQRPQSKDKAKKSDLAKGLCFYCHEPGHMIGSCPKCNKKPSNSRAH
ncbi:MAG: hypothetical protein J3R72DRAFT_507192 [Linnemannia gamsii]|nr:MAG: hypothetical protein J3R72DRAFT_507192 [Linnemannia gamsii]